MKGKGPFHESFVSTDEVKYETCPICLKDAMYSVFCCNEGDIEGREVRCVNCGYVDYRIFE